MSNQIFVLSIVSIGLLGLALTFHLIFFGKKNITAKMLGWYTFLLTLSSVEPLKEYLSTTKYWVEVAVAAGSFMIGPMLFLYCRYRLLNRIQWKRMDMVHFIPAGILLTLMMAAPPPTVADRESSEEVFLYLFFVSHIMAYTLMSFFRILRAKKKNDSESSLQQFHLNFILILVISSLILFIYSFGSTFFRLNDSFHFKLFIQAFLTLIIIVIVLLNAETLEDHEMHGKTIKDFERK